MYMKVYIVWPSCTVCLIITWIFTVSVIKHVLVILKVMSIVLHFVTKADYQKDAISSFLLWYMSSHKFFSELWK